MNNIIAKVSVRTVITILIVLLLFLLMEFTDQNSTIIPFFSTILDGIRGIIEFPNIIATWTRGDLTVAGYIVSITMLLAFGIFVWALFNWVRTVEYKNRRGKNLKLLGSAMFFLWAVGWALFLQAFLCFKTPQPFTNSELLLRTAVSSLRMFMLDLDSTILGEISDHAHLKGAISFVCVLSFVCTFGLLVSLVSARLLAYLKLNYGAFVNKKHSHLYLFWGMNDNMEKLVKSINSNDDKSICIFIEKTISDEDDGAEGWNHLLALLMHRHEAYKKAKDLDARLALTSCSIRNIEGSNDIFGELGLNNIKEKVLKLAKIENAELHFFFLSDDEADNIESVGILKNDETLSKIAESNSNNKTSVVLYCQARRNSINRVVEHASLNSNIEVRLVDPAYLSVQALKMKDKIDLQPVSFVDFDNDGTTSSAFSSLVVGFNEVGQDMVSFLYEFGAFVDADKSNGVKRSPFCCHIVDPDMRSIAPHYMDTHLRQARQGTENNLVSCNESSQAFVNLHSFDYKDQKFFDLLNTIGSTLNYVVIAIDDDVEAIKVAVWILKHLKRMNKDLSNFKIVVRSYSSKTFYHEEKISQYYNKLVGHNVIDFVGKTEDIYSYSNIIGDQIRREAWLYYNSYHGVTTLSDSEFEALEEDQKKSGNYCSDSALDYAWRIRRSKELGVGTNDNPSYAQVMSIRRKEAQDIENSLHRHTKMFVAQKAQRDGVSQLNSSVRTTLAQMEHLRWNASHEMLGYVWGAKRNDDSLVHEYLIDWDYLPSEKIKKYDYNVVDCSFRLAKENNELQNNEQRKEIYPKTN